MSQLLNQLYASGGGLIYHTLDIQNPAFTVPNHPEGRILFVQGFDDLTATTEDSETLTFRASGFGVSPPKKTARGREDLQFQLDNVLGDALHAIDAANASGEKIRCIYRAYSAADLSAPGEHSYKMTAVSARAQGASVVITASFKDIVNLSWPYRRHTPSFAPGLKHA
tara:strand:- start:789 stop:1292 length:504 start_codon:yes stop_codon:yes gene_type:complete